MKTFKVGEIYITPNGKPYKVLAVDGVAITVLFEGDEMRWFKAICEEDQLSEVSMVKEIIERYENTESGRDLD